VSVRDVQAAGRTVAVREWGPPDGMPFLFWHAIGAGHCGSSVAGADARTATAPSGSTMVASRKASSVLG
jgi:hypothetical protein